MTLKGISVAGVLLLFLAQAAVSAAQTVTPLSVRIADEQVPPGGILQVKLEITEPKPISTGGGFFDFGGSDEFVGVAVHSASDDAAAVVVVQPQGLAVRLLSPSSTLGLEPDYPILTMAMRVPASAPLGLRRALNLAGGATFRDPSGAPYPFEFSAGEVLVAHGPAIGSVNPGSAAIPAGAIVTIEGLGFEPDTRVRFKETSLASVRVLSPTLIQAVVAQPTVMHGTGIEVRAGNSRSTYFSYQRTVPIGSSAHPLIAAVHPAFPRREWTRALVRFDPAGASSVHGLALQNLAAMTSTAVLELLDSAGTLVRRASLVLAPNTRAVRALTDLFLQSCNGRACAVRMQASSPLQMLGIVGDVSPMAAAPLLPESDAAGVALATDAAAYRPADTLTLRVDVTSGTGPIVADLYLVLSLSDGSLMSLTPAGLVRGLMPFSATQTFAGATQQTLRLPLTTGTAPGSYAWLSALAVPGTLNLLTSIARADFVVLP